ncbi:uncharacterized protein PGTG_09631 [Puccinia graminis f. sp. tritici CRL 75-36-700-3]|uniref:DDE Tnp4 domain-containing protein n=1 Tax=Puccinia graminis f. sp. tritici (strain CRL 75-36-700-3 / race SCCL) TaxID=418459 RepID=E3KHZ3_PUCGT|nr:uncharacterized protein PGTG_09631 [Puccinia graminis f. sp. tritici CRL 75-36-700-3]EFP83918.1 hypothetical protein PGTG_09631 [Puccinia graminis f. sp. tritici CRL 75-36-700-3]
MVRTSKRQALIKAIKAALVNVLIADMINDLVGFDEDDSSDDDSTDGSSLDEEDFKWMQIEDLLSYLHAVHSQRYLGPRQPTQPAPLDHDQSENLMINQIDDENFKQEFRMSRTSFLKLCEHISNDPVFQNNSNGPQRPVREQLMVTLKRLGCSGNEASIDVLSRFFRLETGTVELYTNRCLMAILRLRSEVLNWPTAKERKAISVEQAKVGFNGCVGFINATLIPLSIAPSKNPGDFYSTKGFFAISTVIVCDGQQNITYLYTGWPGGPSLSRVMSHSGLTLKPVDFFSPGEYLLANSAFTTTPTIVAGYKKPSQGQLTEEEDRFNAHLLRSQALIENCIGTLKGRFQSLNGLRLRIDGKKDQIRVNAWIMACAVLHNFLNQEDEFDFGHVVTEVSDNSNSATNRTAQRATLGGQEQREKITNQVLGFHA